MVHQESGHPHSYKEHQTETPYQNGNPPLREPCEEYTVPNQCPEEIERTPARLNFQPSEPSIPNLIFKNLLPTC